MKKSILFALILSIISVWGPVHAFADDTAAKTFDEEFVAETPQSTISLSGAIEESPAIDLDADFLKNPILDKIPMLKNTVVWDKKDERVDYIAAFEALHYKGFGFNIAYNPAKVLAVGIDYDLVNLKALGVDTPILDLINIRPAIYYGYDRIDLNDMEDTREKIFFGFSVINFKFY